MRYELSGLNFDLMPEQIVGLASSFNDKPLMHINDTAVHFILNPIERDSTHMVLECSIEVQYNSSYYLGGIVSENREIIYFVNNTKPLP